MEILDNQIIDNMDFETQKKYFMELQQFIVKNLETNQRKEYAQLIRTISIKEMNRKIKYAKTWFDVALKNDEIKRGFGFIEKYFPEKLTKIRSEFERTFPNEQLFFLQNKITTLKKVLELRIERMCSDLELNLKEHMEKPLYLAFLEQSEKIEDYHERYEFLQNKLSELVVS